MQGAYILEDYINSLIKNCFVSRNISTWITDFSIVCKKRRGIGNKVDIWDWINAAARLFLYCDSLEVIVLGGARNDVHR